MANTYGRGGAARTSSAQAGDRGSAYEFVGGSPEEFLSSKQAQRYRQATSFLGKKIPKKDLDMYGLHKRALGRAERLRDVASTRAFEEFQAQSTQHSKPWLARSSKGLIESEEVEHEYAGAKVFGGPGGPPKEMRGQHKFSAVGVEAGRSMTGKLEEAQAGKFFLGDPRLRKKRPKIDFGGRTPISGQWPYSD